MSKLLLSNPELDRLDCGQYIIDKAPIKKGVIYSGVRGALYKKALLQLDVGDESMILRRLGRKSKHPKPIQFRVLCYRDKIGKEPKFLKVLHEPLDQISWHRDEAGLWVADTETLGIKRPELFYEMVGKIAIVASDQT